MYIPSFVATILFLPLSILAEGTENAWIWNESPAGKPVIDRGPEGAWDHYAADNPFVLVDNGSYFCFYEGQDKPFPEGGHEQIGLAVSHDGLHWKKSPNNPILSVGPSGSWDSIAAKLPVAIRHGDKFYLFYSGRNAKTKQIGLAISSDLVHWRKQPENPVLRSRPGKWDAFLSTLPAPVFSHNGHYYLLFRGMESLYRKQGLGIAVSDDLLKWDRLQDGPAIPVDEETASLAVTQTAKGYVGIAQNVPKRDKRPCWISKDLTHWNKGPSVRFTGSSVDTLSNPFLIGDRWAVVYEQKDRIYRAFLEDNEALNRITP